MKRCWFCTIALLPMFFLFVSADGQAGGDKATPWKPILSDDAYKALTSRSIERIETLARAGDKDAQAKIVVEAALLAGATLSVKNRDADDVLILRAAAVTAGKSDLKALANFSKSIKAASKDAKELKDPKLSLQELPDMMEIFRNKSKGGEGLHADLQYSPQLKNLNGIEALIGALAKKKLSDDNLAKVSKELPTLAYRIAVVSALTHEFAPAKGAGEWRAMSIQMRDASIALADAAQKKNGADVLKAATSLESTCTQCHSAFKSK